jgi:hypothetical protein
MKPKIFYIFSYFNNCLISFLKFFINKSKLSLFGWFFIILNFIIKFSFCVEILKPNFKLHIVVDRVLEVLRDTVVENEQ